MSRWQQCYALFQRQAWPELFKCAQSWLQDDPCCASAHDFVALACSGAGQYQRALPHFERYAELAPEDANSWDHLALCLYRLKRFDEAANAFEQALALSSDLPDLRLRAAMNSMALGQSAQAIALLEAQLDIQPEALQARYLLLELYRQQQRFDDAVHCAQVLTEQQPNWPQGWLQLGALWLQKQAFEPALRAYLAALVLQPSEPTLQLQVAALQQRLARPVRTLEHCRAAQYLGLESAQLDSLMGEALADLGEHEAADVAFAAATAKQAEALWVVHNRLFCLNYHPDLTPSDLARRYRIVLTHFNRIEAHSRPAVIAERSECRLRLGIVSPDLRRHSISAFLLPLLEALDAAHFELFAYADLAFEDAITQRYRACMDHWCDSTQLNHAALAARIRDDGIDILLDVCGHNAGSRMAVFASKPAVLQVSWLGYAHSTGLNAMDAFIGDDEMLPTGCEADFSETKLVRLPVTPWSYRPLEPAPAPASIPSMRCGHITYGVLTRPIRLNNALLAMWAELLHRVPNARLRFDSAPFADEPTRRWIERCMARWGIAAERIECGYHTPIWSALHHIDVVLDCVPHNNGTTSIESLYAGVPFVTLRHRPPEGRIGASLLRTLGYPEWICNTPRQYIECAAALGRAFHRRLTLRRTLRTTFEATSLGDNVAFAAHFTTACHQLWQTQCAP